MQHLDPDRLVLLALGESLADEAESNHLVDCTACHNELDAMRHIAELGAATQDLRELARPPQRVWQRIEAEVLETRAPAAPAAAPPRWGRRPAERRARPEPRRPAWVRPLLVAAAAAVIGVAGTVAVTRFTADRPPEPRVTASAALSPLPTAPGSAAGAARVLTSPGQPEELHLHVQGLPLSSGYYQVWLINPDTKAMFPLGALGATEDALLPLPGTVNLNDYKLVDVSAEQYDNNAAHSGKSLLRGTLTS